MRPEQTQDGVASPRGTARVVHVLLPRAEQGVGTLGAGPGPLRVRVGGAAELSAGGDLALAHAGR